MAKISSLFNMPMPNKKHLPSGDWILPKQYIGLEFEYEQARRAAMTQEFLNYYTRKEDGSLRDDGIEFTFTEPYFGEDLSYAIDLLWKQNQGFVCNYRTGTHVHLDCRDMEEQEVYRLLLLYCVFEKSLFNFLGNDRDKSNFCIPWHRSKEHFSSLSYLGENQPAISPHLDRGAEIQNTALYSVIAKIGRYSALNCAALAKFGTVEFRQMENSLDKQKLINWVNIIMSLKKYVMENEFTGDSLLKDISSVGPIAFTSRVFNEKLAKLLRDSSSDLGVDIFDGVYLAQDLLLSNIQLPAFSKSKIESITEYVGENETLAKLIKNRIEQSKVPAKATTDNF